MFFLYYLGEFEMFIQFAVRVILNTSKGASH